MEFGHKRPFLLEGIDGCSIDAVIISEGLAGQSGQVTIERTLPGRAITLQLSAVLPYENHRQDMLDEILAVFDPTLDGKLRIITKNADFEIDCYPMSVPLPEKTAVGYKYNFEVKLFADDPFFKRGAEISKQFTENYNYIHSRSTVHVPMKVIFPAGYSGPFSVNGVGTTMMGYNGIRILDTSDASLVDEQGNDVSQFMNCTAEMDQTYLKYGKNLVFCMQNSGAVELRYYEYALGVL